MTDGFISKGYSPTESDYEKIRQFTRKEFAKDELYVFEAVLCSNDIDRDYEKFSVGTLNELRPSDGLQIARAGDRLLGQLLVL